MKILSRKMRLALHDIYWDLKLLTRRKDYGSKVFCIGFNKTGTSSFGRALRLLGFSHISFNNRIWRQYKDNQIIKVLQQTAKFDAVDDLPWLKEDMIPVLDRVFPNSKFVFLIRDEEPWKKSIYNWTFKLTGKYPDIEEKLEEYRNHKAFVLDYFKDWPADRFLILDITDEDGFQKLAAFLGKTTDQKGFPHVNQTSQIS